MPTLTSEKKAARPAGRSNGRRPPELLFGDLWEYDPAPETADPKLKPRYDLFIGGPFGPPASGPGLSGIRSGLCLTPARSGQGSGWSLRGSRT